MNELNNIIYMDDREKKDTQIIASIIYDNLEITRLDIGDI